MRRLIYASRSTDAYRRDDKLMLQQIVAKSIQNNRASSLTGFLLTFDGVFLQVLEGPDAAIGETYARIAGDKRHDRLTVITDQVADERAFRDWNMCGVSLLSGDPLLAEHRLARVASREGRFDADAALSLLQAVARMESERERQAALGAA